MIPPAVLIIEDSPPMLALVAELLARHGFRAVSASDAASGLRAALAESPALVILDLGLPDGDGLTLAAELRHRGVGCPLLMLTARGAIPDRVAGLDAGADDYLAKPFDTTELLARVRALLRRTTTGEATSLRVGDLSLDSLQRSARRGERVVPLTQREFALLAVLMRHAGRAVTREALAAEAWQQHGQSSASTNLVDVYIAYLRRKLEGEGQPPLLHTVRGVGYVLHAEPEPANA